MIASSSQPSIAIAAACKLLRVGRSTLLELAQCTNRDYFWWLLPKCILWVRMNANEACLVGHMLYKNVYLLSKMERRASTAPQIQFPEMIPTTPMLLQLSQKYTTTTYTHYYNVFHIWLAIAKLISCIRKKRTILKTLLRLSTTKNNNKSYNYKNRWTLGWNGYHLTVCEFSFRLLVNSNRVRKSQIALQFQFSVR